MNIKMLAFAGLLRNLLVSLAVLCAPTSLLASSVPNLVEKSNLVVVAKVFESVHSGDTTSEVNGTVVPAGIFMARAQVLRDIKGHCDPQITIVYSMPVAFTRSSVLRSGTQVLFLQQTSAGISPTDMRLPGLPAVEEYTPRKGSNSSILQQVMEELGEVVASPIKATWEKVYVLSQSPWLPPLKSFDNQLKAGLSTSDDNVRYMIMAALIRRDDVSTLPSVQELLLTDSLPRERNEGLLTAISYFLKNPAASSTLKTLIHSPDTTVRRAAVMGMGHVGDSTAVPLLIAALDDSDSEVQHEATASLGLITGQHEWVCTSEEFENNRPKYIQHWKEWASKPVQ